MAAVVLLAGCSGDGTAGVRTAVVGRGTVTEVVEAPGTVVARASARVTAPAAGRVAVLLVRDGQAVKAGQVLLRIDSPEAGRALARAQDADRQAADAARVDLPRADLGVQEHRADKAADQAFTAAREAASRIPDATARAQALAAAAAAEAQYAAARAQADAAVRSLNDGIGSLGDALSALGAAQRVQTRAAVDIAQRTVDALVVPAPISGVVTLGATGSAPAAGGDLSAALSQVPESLRGAAGAALGGARSGGSGGAAVDGVVALGSPVQSGQALLAVTDVSGLSLTAEVDETDVLLVKPGVEADVDFDAVPGATYRASVLAVDVNPTTSGAGNVAYVVRLELSGGMGADGEPAPAPRPGMSAIVDLHVRTAKDVLAVPASAVFRDGDHDAVWLVDAGTARRTAVQVGAQGADLVELREGVREGARVVVAGADRVSPGQRLP